MTTPPPPTAPGTRTFTLNSPEAYELLCPPRAQRPTFPREQSPLVIPNPTAPPNPEHAGKPELY